MKMYHPENGKGILLFTEHNFESPAEEFGEVMTILRRGGCEYEGKCLLTEIELYRLNLNGSVFFITTDLFDRRGCILTCDDKETISLIEKIFTDAGVEWCEEK